MGYHVVSTKLNQEEHEKFLEFCNKKGFTTSAFIKNSIMTSMSSESKKDEYETAENKLREALGLEKK